MTLHERLLAAITARRDRAAAAAHGYAAAEDRGEWHTGALLGTVVNGVGEDVVYNEYHRSEAEAEHIAGNDPAFTLRGGPGAAAAALPAGRKPAAVCGLHGLRGCLPLRQDPTPGLRLRRTPGGDMIVYISIGNSDDKLTQQRWSNFVADVQDGIDHVCDGGAAQVHGRWFSLPNAPFQNACWCVEFVDDPHLGTRAGWLRRWLINLTTDFDWDSIKWDVCTTPEFLTPDPA